MTKRLSDTQVQVLHLLDKKGHATYPGRYSRTADVLRELGFVSVQIFWERGFSGNELKRVHMVMTKHGSDFVFNGGLDHERNPRVG